MPINFLKRRGEIEANFGLETLIWISVSQRFRFRIMILSSATSKSSNFGPNGPSNQPFPDSTTSVDKSSNDSPIARPSTVLDQSDPAAKEELRNNLLNHASSARPARLCPNDLIEPYEEIEQIGRGMTSFWTKYEKLSGNYMDQVVGARLNH